jgi:hypothetical protein
LVFLAAEVAGQAPAAAPESRDATPSAPAAGQPQWRGSGDGAGAPAAAAPSAPASAITKVTKGSGVLPNDHGQVWREYDIEPYTSRVTSTAKPEQAVIDWILRETGTDVWFSEPVGILCATPQKLLVYHTPQMQRIVHDVVDRFVASEAESHVLALRVVTIGSPNWRTIAHRIIRPVEVQTPGVEAWLLSRENAALLVSELSKRTDYREHAAPNLVIHNGQASALSRVRPKNYIRNVHLRGDVLAGYELVMGQLEEGFSLSVSPLFSTDKSTIDAVVKVEVDQVEKLVPVVIDVPAAPGQTQRIQIQVPQMVRGQLHERFRWPADQVLLISGGVSATPAPKDPSPLGIPNPFDLGPGRADALLFLEYKGKSSQALVEAQRAAESATSNNRGRY